MDNPRDDEAANTGPDDTDVSKGLLSDRNSEIELKPVSSSLSDGADAEDKSGDGVVRMSYDEAMRRYHGRYQLIIFILLVCITFSTAYNNNGYVFIGANQDHTCIVPGDVQNWTDSDNRSAEIVYSAGSCTFNKTAIYEDGTNRTLETNVECNSWIYDQSEFKLTIMSEWNLNSCGGKWKIALASSMYMIGFFIGCILLADLSDRFGRSKIMLISNIGMVVTGVIASFSVSYEMLVIMRLLLGVCTAGSRNAAFVYVCETVKYRGATGILHGFFYTLGAIAVTAISHLLPNWRHFQLACACSYALFIPYYWIMPESPRWMLNKGNTAEANKYFQRTAKFNKIDIPKNLEVYLDNTAKSEGNVLSLFRGKNVLKKTFLVCLMWFSVSIVFFGMAWNVGNLYGNIFINNYLIQSSGLLMFIGIWFVQAGRRICISSCFLIAFAACAVIPIFSQYGIHYAVVIMGMVGKLLIEINFEGIYVITAEIYPTNARVTALGLGSGLARLGGALSPYLVLSHDFWPNMPYVLFGVFSLIAGLAALKLPETKGRTLPDSLEQVEMENPLSSFFSCCKKNTEESVSAGSSGSTESIK